MRSVRFLVDKSDIVAGLLSPRGASIHQNVIEHRFRSLSGEPLSAVSRALFIERSSAHLRGPTAHAHCARILTYEDQPRMRTFRSEIYRFAQSRHGSRPKRESFHSFAVSQKKKKNSYRFTRWHEVGLQLARCVRCLLLIIPQAHQSNASCVACLRLRSRCPSHRPPRLSPVRQRTERGSV